jgi:hypothetical protein
MLAIEHKRQAKKHTFVGIKLDKRMVGMKKKIKNQLLSVLPQDVLDRWQPKL